MPKKRNLHAMKQHRHLKNIILYALLSTLTGVWSCRKDVHSFEPYDQTLDQIGLLLAQTKDASTHTIFTLGGSIPDTLLKTASGVRVFLTDTENLFADNAGTPIPCSACQTLTVELNESLSKSAILASELFTQSTEGKVLESSGMVEINVTCNGKKMQLQPGRNLKIQIPANDLKQGWNIYGSVFNKQVFAGWKKITPDDNPQVYWADWQVFDPFSGNNVTKTGYELIADSLGWIGCHRNLNEPTTNFCVSLPVTFTPQNTRVFLLVKNARSVVELNGEALGQQFCLDKAPLGYTVQLITVSKVDGAFWLGNTVTEIGTNATVPIQPGKITEQQLLDFLNKL